MCCVRMMRWHVSQSVEAVFEKSRFWTLHMAFRKSCPAVSACQEVSDNSTLHHLACPCNISFDRWTTPLSASRTPIPDHCDHALSPCPSGSHQDPKTNWSWRKIKEASIGIYIDYFYLTQDLLISSRQEDGDLESTRIEDLHDIKGISLVYFSQGNKIWISLSLW